MDINLYENDKVVDIQEIGCHSIKSHWLLWKC